MTKSILVTGGARSGKSVFAERYALHLSPCPTYIATAQAWDAEMETRIADHQARRGDEWTTMNVPLDLKAALEKTDTGPARLLDCLTLWLSNLFGAEKDIHAEIDALVACLGAQSSPVVIVTNEVGSGIVPENALARAFRDAAGALNQTVAAQVDEVYCVVSGQPMKVKPNDTLPF